MESRKYREDAMHEVHRILVGARPRQGDIDDPENWARYDLIWPHLGPSEAYRCDTPDTRHLLIDRVRYLWKRGEFKAALEVGRFLVPITRTRCRPLEASAGTCAPLASSTGPGRGP
jgi:hypothetical protein